MTSRTATSARRAPARRSSPQRVPARRRAVARRRRIGLLVVAAVVLAVALLSGVFRQTVQEISLPLRHEDIIRQQSKAKGLDPALVAGVIYTESHFNPRPSPAGAQGLMQLLPSTAHFIAARSGGTAFTTADLATPQVNISYGTWYLRYLIRRYGGNDALAIAAYNGGETNVDRWLVRAAKSGRTLQAQDIPFPETRAYVEKVLTARQDYRDHYARELGL
jgi:soluble lytic murein transglycosylase